MSKVPVFDSTDLPVFNLYEGYYGEIRFGVLPNATKKKIQFDVDRLLKKMEIQVIAFIPSQCRHRVRWYVKLPENENEMGAVGWDYIPVRKK